MNFNNITYIHQNNLQSILDKTEFHTVIISRYICFLERFKNILIIAVKRSAPVYLVSNFAKKKRSSDLVTLVSGGLSCNKSGKDLPDSLLLQLGRPENGD